MAKFKVNKTKDYTIMSNYHLKEKDMSLKAKGLLSIMLSLPGDWDYSIAGLVAICRENETAIKSTLLELKKFGYLEVIKLMPNESETGRIDYIYNIYEIPKQESEKQEVENLPLEILEVENQGQSNINNKYNNTSIINTNNKYISDKPKKYKFGKYQRIKLTNEEYSKLCEEFGISFIEKQINLLDEYVESNNNKNKYTNFNLVLRKSIRENWFVKSKKDTPEWLDKSVEVSNASKEEQEEIEKMIKEVIN